MAPNPASTHATPGLAALADQCVMCGLCLPRCPTYAVDALEGRSPRGRIAHMRRLAADPDAATPSLLADLDSCLSCGRCEAACPSQVRYAAMLPQARALLRTRRSEPMLQRLLRALAKRPTLLRALLRLARRLPRQAARHGERGGLHALLAAAHAIAPSALAATPTAQAVSSARGRVLLLRGCVGAAVEGDTHEAAARLLSRAGYTVVLSPDRSCCGSLARQAGALDEAARDAERLRAVVRTAGVDAVVSCASGCLPALREALAAPETAPVHELLAFLDGDAAACARDSAPAAAARRVALSVPCTQRTLDGGRAARRALAASAGVELVELPEAPGCCGAGALQFVFDPATAARLRRERVAQIVASGACMVATSNTGCRLHLAMGLAEAGLDLPVVHPAVIIGGQLPPDDAPCAATPPATA